MKSSLLQDQKQQSDYGTNNMKSHNNPALDVSEENHDDDDAKKDSSSVISDYDSALSQVGYGKWHYWLAWVCGWANASDAIELLCISFLLPSAECDLELTNFRKSAILMIGFVGMLVGGFMWGTLGRRKYEQKLQSKSNLESLVISYHSFC